MIIINSMMFSNSMIIYTNNITILCCSMSGELNTLTPETTTLPATDNTNSSENKDDSKTVI